MDVKCPNCGTDNTQESEFCKKCGTQIKASEDKSIPTQTLEVPKEELTTGSTFAGRYRIIEELGRGGMGRVYKAIEQYRIFLDLWKDADPGRAEVDDAKAGLARLNKS